MVIAAVLCAVGGLLAFLTIRRPDEPADSRNASYASHCSIDAPSRASATLTSAAEPSTPRSSAVPRPTSPRARRRAGASR